MGLWFPCGTVPYGTHMKYPYGFHMDCPSVAHLMWPSWPISIPYGTHMVSPCAAHVPLGPSVPSLPHVGPMWACLLGLLLLSPRNWKQKNQYRSGSLGAVGATPPNLEALGSFAPRLRTVDVVHFYFCLFLHVNLGPPPKKKVVPNLESF